MNWLWKGHHVYLFDGTTMLMPDTAENREAYPLVHNQKEGLPLMRVAAIFSLSCGIILDLAAAKYAGKGQGEVTLLRQLWQIFSKGDILLADCLMCNWRNLFELNGPGDPLVSVDTEKPGPLRTIAPLQLGGSVNAYVVTHWCALLAGLTGEIHTTYSFDSNGNFLPPTVSPHSHLRQRRHLPATEKCNGLARQSRRGNTCPNC